MRSSIGCAALLALALALSIPAAATAAPVPLAQVGTFGSGAGQLNNPLSVALDGDGNLYVADTANDRISVFGPDGTFTHAFGWSVDTGAAMFEVCTTASTCQAGQGGVADGQFSDPGGVAVDGAGNLYVGDQLNNRIDVFDTAGPSFTRAFGWGVDTGAAAFEVCTTASTCQAGSIGGGAGQMHFPNGVALDGAGGLYVTDAFNNRISVFGIAGPSFTRAFGWGVDTGAAAFEVCTTGSGCQTGSAGGGAGQLNSPQAAVSDGAGGLYVANTINNRIDLFGTAGPSFTRAFGSGVDTGAAAFEVCTTGSGCQAGNPIGGAGALAFPAGVALDGTGGLFVGDGVNNRIGAFGTAGPSFTRAFGWDVIPGMPTGLFEVCTTMTTCDSGSTGSGVGQLNDAEGVAADCRGAVWVADNNNGRVQRFGEPGTPLPPCPFVPPPSGGGTVPGTTTPLAPVVTVTGRRAAALKKCKKLPKGPRRTKCIKRAKKLPA